MRDTVKCGDCIHYANNDCKIACWTIQPEDEGKCSMFEHIADAGKKVSDAVNHPSHYTQGGIECIDCIKAALGENFIGFLIGNVIKYTYRYKHKNGLEDLKKAAVYLEWAIKEMERVEKS